MSLTLTVDGDRWRRHLVEVATAQGPLVPVAKGNGYGLTIGRLARKAQWLRDQRGLPVDTLAVGTYEELAQVAQRFDGSLLVLTPWRPWGAALRVDPAVADRVVHTVSRPEDLSDLLDRRPEARFVVEQLTSMRRHGMTPRELRAAAADLAARRGARLEGMALHLPLARGSQLPELERLLNDLVASELDTTSVWVSHVPLPDLAELRTSYADLTFRPRVGTALWLGDRGALRVTSRVLDVHPLGRGEPYGYRGRTVTRGGHLVVASGGTAHGLGLEAPTGDTSLRARASALAKGGLDAAGLVRSPFIIGGCHARFAEPPHMQASMLFLPAGSTVPGIGDELEVRVRYTTTTFDAIVLA
jgi:Alanine racemase, N-terminal domain